MGKKRSRRSADTSKESTPVRAVDSEEEQPVKKKNKGPKTSADLAREFKLQDVQLEYTDADFQNLTTFSLFVRLFRPQIAAVNSKATSTQLNQILEGKWREFQESNQQSKDDEEEDGDSPMPSEKSEDSESSVEEAPPKRTRTKATLKKNIAAKRSGGVVMPTVTSRRSDSDDDDTDKSGEAPPRSRSMSRRQQKSRQVSEEDEDSPAPPPSRSRTSSRKRKPVQRSEEEELSEASEEEPPKRKSTGLLKIKLPLPSSTRKSKRERKIYKADEDVEKFFDDDSDTQDYVDKKKKKKPTDDEFDSQDTEEEAPKPKKRVGPKRLVTTTKKTTVKKSQKAYQVSSDSSSSSDSDTSFKKSGRNTPAEKVYIPGERQSQRDRKRKSLAELSDKQFDEMLKHKEKEEARALKRKKKQKEKRDKEHTFLGKRGAWQGDKKEGAVEVVDSGEESDHYWYCQICKDGGDLLLCDGCPRSFHQKCLKLETVPEGEWKCPVCKGEDLPDPEEEEEEGDTGHDTTCKECKNDGELLLCDFCSCSYHLECLNPVLVDVPEGEWKCPRCILAEKPLKGKVERILTWRWSNVDKKSSVDELDHTHSPVKKKLSESEEKDDKEDGKPKKQPERELFVKFQYYSYWDCEWITQLQLEVFNVLTERMFRTKWDQDEPPADFDMGAQTKHDKGDKYNLYERYLRWGIKYDWLCIHRILTHEKEGGRTRYLVKWRERPYEDATYEEEGELPDGIQDWKKHVNAYWLRRKQVEGGKQRADIPEKKPKKKELRKQWEVQPPYIEATGGKLHPYQLEGVNWMRFSYGQDTNTILADEMGLGKTVQAATFIYSLWKEGYAKGPFLISAPLSTVTNWEREFEFWAPDMYVVTYNGGKENRAIIREREICYREGAFKMNTYSKPSALREGYKPKFDVLLTSYEYPSMDFALLSSFKWSVLVIDEAHRLKSNQSLFFRMMSKYKIDYRLLLTGTPLQNNLEELFNLLNFLERDKFMDLEAFLEEFSDIGKEEQVVRLHEMLAPHMLRRLKIDVLKDIPAKSEFIVRVELSPMQKKFYKLILTKNYTALNVKGYSHQTTLMNIMMDLRKCCNHPYLFPSALSEAPVAPGGYLEGNALTKACGKLELLSKMLRKLKAQGHRVLVFSQMTRVLDLLEDFMIHLQFDYERIDGGISGSVRQERIDRFNDMSSTSFVFLLSTKAGGLGINLATADTVIIYDMDWNPHNDIQALSRAHRIGQKNKVMIYRFVSRNSVEERMAQVCKQKMMLSELVIAKGKVGDGGLQKKTESLSKQELNEILKFGAENLFKDDESGKLVYDDEAVEKMLDRTLDDDAVPESGTTEEGGGTKVGLNDYLRSFKVATYMVKDVDEDEEEEEVEPEPSTSAATGAAAGAGAGGEEEKDENYWQRILGDEYSLHVAQLHQEQEELARTLGKGKRIRKQINYAEQAMLESANQKKKRNIEVITQDDEFQPTTSESESDEIEDDEENDPNVQMDGEEKKRKKEENKKDRRDRHKGSKHGKDGKDKDGGAAGGAPKESNELPPLLARVNGKIEVLGFCARQRRAFLDAVMRFGMPPEDAFHSQWLVRDLKHKRERVLKAYVSLFMRHLCEPVQEDSHKFADGVPREGMSQQHVLTRIGIIALIRRKVNEYEKTNKTHSMAEFKTAMEEQKQAKMLELEKRLTEAPVTTEEGEKKDEKKDEKEEKSEDKGEKMEVDEKKDEKMEITESEEKDKDKEEKDKDKKEEEKDKEEKDKEDEIKIEGDEKVEKVEEKVEKVEEKDSEVKESDPGTEKDSDSKDKDVEKDQKESPSKEKESPSKEKESPEKENDEASPSKEKDKETDKEEESPSKETKSDKEKDSTSKESEEKDTPSKEKGNESPSKKTEKEKGSPSKKTDEEKESPSKDKASPSKESPQKGKKSPEKVVEIADDDTTTTPKKKTTPVKKLSEEELKKVLRRRFWIADGGFTELHAVWAYEEGLMEVGREYEHWHRRHDFWLLSGVVTHGYRHWQDILSDPRYEILNRAFRTDQERLRKAAFLNRRFQLLEQALVIEEQLRKAATENEAWLGPKDAVSEEVGIHDGLAQLDNFAATLRRISQGQAIPGQSPDAKVHKAINNLSSLINDVKAATYKTMPATLAKAPTAPPQQSPAAPTPAAAAQAQKSAAVITID